MNTVVITEDSLLVQPHGSSRLRAPRRELQIPLSEVLGAVINPSILNEPKGIRGPGIAFFGRYSGTYVRAGERSFWNVRPGSGDDIVVITLRGDHFTRLVLSVDDPGQLVRDINRVLIG